LLDVIVGKPRRRASRRRAIDGARLLGGADVVSPVDAAAPIRFHALHDIVHQEHRLAAEHAALVGAQALQHQPGCPKQTDRDHHHGHQYLHHRKTALA
jgi:hypothetical protein